MSLNVLIAPSGFKESLGASEAADFIAAGVQRAMPDARILKAPMADGGGNSTNGTPAPRTKHSHRIRIQTPKTVGIKSSVSQ